MTRPFIMTILTAILTLLTTQKIMALDDHRTEEETMTIGEPKSEIIKTDNGDLFLKHTIILEAGLDQVWDTFTTEAGVTAWMVPVARLDFRIGGSLKTHYARTAAIGDPGTIVLNVVNYAPHHFLTLQSDLNNAALPPIAKENAHRLFNIIEFEALDNSRTKVVSWGIGYSTDPAWEPMLQFFIQGNEFSLRNLTKALAGHPVDWENLEIPARE